MTTTSELRQITAEALKAGTAAGINVFAARTWPTWSGSYPIIWIHSPAEDKESLGRQGGPQFTVTATIRISARVQLKALPRNAAAGAMILALEGLQRQIERALINFPPLMSRLQQFPFIRSEMTESDDGDQSLGELVMDVGMEFYQGPEDFYPLEDPAMEPPFDPVAAAAVNPVVPLNEVLVVDDLTNVFDQDGTYPDPPFPDAVHPAPRTSGPDGRSEGGLSLDLTPQE
ncbi:phage tail protein [Pseudomonas chlororaphis]|uniref:phage tail protein n=1 Tax=Pseudomonas chlororaphis TaxID=587753 RepID=UPI00209BA446|nr:phage tail protein [Pseudomonas chlororaphis]MCO7569372.1 phage tail protein [Pseudomonas chlororaphis]MCO7586783.1 phage tail protein [Pseudomonas chlororaphis]